MKKDEIIINKGICPNCDIMKNLSEFNKEKSICLDCCKKVDDYNQANAISFIEIQLTDIRETNHKYRILKAAAEQTINFYMSKLKEIEEKRKHEIEISKKYIENSLEEGIKKGYLTKEITCITAVIKKEKKGITIKWI